MWSRRAFLILAGGPLLTAQQPGSEMFVDAEACERFMGGWSRRIAPRLVDFAEVPGRGRVLDVGSGTGSLALAIDERKPHCGVVGIDVSRQYVAYAARRE